MIDVKTNYSLLKCSDSTSYLFYISTENKINYNFYDNKAKLIRKATAEENAILDYSVDIDKDDRVHLLYLAKDGTLIYKILIDGQWSSYKVTKFDVKSNRFKHLILKVISKSVHIFYGQSNMLNPNIWSIVHAHGTKGRWNKSNVISITPGRFEDPFVVDFDKLGNIHLIFQNISKGSKQIYYTSFNTFLKRWMKSPQKISFSNFDNLHPFIFADNNNNIHVVWDCQINSKSQIKYAQMPCISNTKLKWNNYEIEQNDTQNSHPIIFQENRTLKIAYIENDTLSCISSDDYGLTWDKDGCYEYSSFTNTKLIHFSSNSNLDKNRRKMNRLYGNVDENILLYFSNFLSKPSINQDPIPSDKEAIHYSHEDKNICDTVDLEETYTPSDDGCKENTGSDLQNHSAELSNNSSNDITNDIDDLVNDHLIKYARDTKIGLESILSNSYELKNKSKEIKSIIYSNLKDLDNHLLRDKDVIENLTNSISSMEKLLLNYKKQNDEINSLLDSIKEFYHHNNAEVEKVSFRLTEIDNLIKEASMEPSQATFWEKLVRLFK